MINPKPLEELSMKAAEQARLAYLGSNQAECVPWDELKPEMRERWARVVDAAQKPIYAELEDVTAERDAANERAEQAEAERDDLRCESSLIGELRTILGLGWGESITERCRELAALRAQLDAAQAECKHLNAVIMDMGPVDATPTDAQVEALAKAMQSAYSKYIGYWPDWDTWSHYRQDSFRAQARAAYAHIGRVPVGWELDVTEQAIRNAWLDAEAGGGNTWNAAKAVLDLCRSRIKPVSECKECAKLRDEVTFWKRENVASNNQILSAIATLQAPRAALEGE